MPPYSLYLVQLLNISCFLPLKKAYSRKIKQLMRINIIYISKLKFLYRFREALFTLIIEKNIQGGFARAGLMPYNPERVISKLDIRIRTPTPLTLSLTTALP